jgi:hypothetical protein
MPSRVSAFVEYVLRGAYEQRSPESKFFMMTISKKSMAHALGGHNLGSAQKEQLREECIGNEIGFSEVGDRVIFFDPSRITDFSVEMDDKEDDLKKAIDHFVKDQGSIDLRGITERNIPPSIAV